MTKKRAGAAVRNDDDLSACRICRMLLNRFEHPDGSVTLEHGRPWVTDHQPDPVPVDQVAVTRICDFCSGGPVIALFSGSDTRGYDARGRYNVWSGLWSACAKCDSYVVLGDVDGMRDWVDRYLESQGKMNLSDPRPLWNAFLPTVTSRNLLIDVPRLRASTLPKVRDAMANYWRGRFALGPTGRTTSVAASLVDADLFWVSANFTTMAVVSGAKLRNAVLTENTSPAPAGLLVWDAPVASMPHRPDGYADTIAVSWTPRATGGFYLVGYALASQVLPWMEVATLRADVGWLVPVHQPIPVAFTEISGAAQVRIIDDPDHEQDATALAGYIDSLLKTLAATWLLMKQPGVAEQRDEEPDKAIRRSYGRAGRRAPKVRLVDLRRRPRRDGATGRTFSYSVQFLVSGYWKERYAGRPLPEPTFVSPYLKGPENAPFKMPGDKVNLLR